MAPPEPGGVPAPVCSRRTTSSRASSYPLGDPQGQFITLGGSYVRQALKDGLAMQAAEGYNPFRTGFVGGSDPHNTAIPYRQDDFFGGHPGSGAGDGSGDGLGARARTGWLAGAVAALTRRST